MYWNQKNLHTVRLQPSKFIAMLLKIGFLLNQILDQACPISQVFPSICLEIKQLLCENYIIIKVMSVENSFAFDQNFFIIP